MYKHVIDNLATPGRQACSGGEEDDGEQES
jgi:hypothetical protein